MYVRSNKHEQAYKVISRYLPESEYTMLYIKEAQNFEREGKYKDAEKMYLTANEPDLAINMYKNAELYDHMIRLVAKHRRDLLLDTHRHLAQQLETSQNLKQAEHHYIEGDQWMHAVEMYKVYEMWEDAIRVSKAHGNQKEVTDIAIKIAESMGQDQGRQFLIKNNLQDAAIDYEANKKNFDAAFELASNSIYKKPDVHLKYAMHLEDNGQFKEAEDHYISANKPGEAIAMYEAVKDWHSALRVARQYVPEQVDHVFVNQAKFFMERQEIQKAEQAYLSAKQPEMAVEAWLSIKNYPEALRVAKQHGQPHLIQRINQIYSGGGRENANAQDIYKSAKMWEDSNNYSKAIDGYLEITEHHSQDTNFLEDCWERAYTLAMQYEKSRINEVVNTVGNRLQAIGKYNSAGDIFETAGDFESAVDAFMSGNQFDRALNCAQQVQPPHLRDRMIQDIQNRRKQQMLSQGNAAELAAGGDLSGLEQMFNNGQYEQCLDLASRQGENVLDDYLGRYTKMLIQNGEYKKGLQAFTKYSCPTNQGHLPIYKTLALEVLAGAKEDEMQGLREML